MTLVLGQSFLDVVGVGISVLAFAVSFLGLFLSRRDRKARLEILVRYEYRAVSAGGCVRARGSSQEELLASLGDFLRQHDLGRADGEPVVSFVLRNRGASAVYPRTARLLLLSGGKKRLAGLLPLARRERPLVVDPSSGTVSTARLSGGAEAVTPTTEADRRLPEQISPGKSVGLWCNLSSLSRTLVREGHRGELDLALRIQDQIGNVFTARFRLDTDIWEAGDRQRGEGSRPG